MVVRDSGKLSLLVSLALFGCTTAPPVPTAEIIPTVSVVKATMEDLTQETEITAEFQPSQEIDLHAKVAGYLKAIYVDVGDLVQKGQLLAELEIPETLEELVHSKAMEKKSELDVTRAESEVKGAESSLKLRELTYQRLAAVAKSKPNLIAQMEIDSAQARFQEGESQLASAQAALAAIRQQVVVASSGTARVQTMMGYQKLYAPFSGQITKRSADPGVMVQAGTASQSQAIPVVRLSQVDHLKLVLPVPESIVPRVKVNTPVEIRVEVLKRVFQGKVSRITGRLETSTRTMDTEVDVPNPGLVLKPGMFAYVRVATEQRNNVVAVPVQAVSIVDGKASILVVNSNHIVESRAVELGLETPEKLEVRSGVRDGELLIIGAGNQIKAGAHVLPKAAK